MTERDLVRILRDLFIDNGKTMERRDGPEALTAAQELADIVSFHLVNEAGYDWLWDDFKREPARNTAELTGALEALEEADPALALQLSSLLGDYYNALGPIPDRLPTPEGDAHPEEKAGYNDIEDRPDWTQASDYNEEGTYLYGNVQTGTVQIEQEFREGGVEPEQEVNLPREGVGGLVSEAELDTLMDPLKTAVEERTNMSAADKEKLLAELSEVHRLVAAGADAGPALLVHHFRTIEQIAPDFLELLFLTLTAPNLNLPTVRRIIQNYRLPPLAAPNEEGV